MTGWLAASPTLNEEALGFSPAGITIHERAHRIAIERALACGPPLPTGIADEPNRFGT